MEDIKKALEDLKEAIQKNDAFARYRASCAEVRQYPEKEARLQEFRKKNYMLQNSSEPIDLFVELERLAQEYSDVYQDPLLSEYLASELALCRIVQQISREVIGCLDFEAAFVED